MKKIIGSIILLCLVFTFVGCSVERSAEDMQVEQTKTLIQEMNNQIGLPEIKEFYEKKMAKEIFELRDNSKLICYAYTKNEMTGKYVYEGKCMGYGLPYSTQYTNPMQYTGVTTKHVGWGEGGEYSYSYELMPQADPNGLYTPTGLSSTWLMIINEETGEREVEYYEPAIVVTQSKKPKRLCEEWSLPKDY